MRRTLLCLALLAPLPMLAQTATPLPTYTVGTLPAASTMSGKLARVTDGTTASDCTVGGGTFLNTCRSNGTVWAQDTLNNGAPSGLDVNAIHSNDSSAQSLIGDLNITTTDASPLTLQSSSTQGAWLNLDATPSGGAKFQFASGSSASTAGLGGATGWVTLYDMTHNGPVFYGNASTLAVESGTVFGWGCDGYHTATPCLGLSNPTGNEIYVGNGQWNDQSRGMVMHDITVGGGTQLSRYARYGVSLTPAAVAANTCASQTFTATGIAAADILIGISKPTEQAGLSVTPGHVTAANTATLNFCNVTAASITPTAAETYQFVVVQ